MRAGTWERRTVGDEATRRLVQTAFVAFVLGMTVGASYASYILLWS